MLEMLRRIFSAFQPRQETSLPVPPSPERRASLLKSWARTEGYLRDARAELSQAAEGICSDEIHEFEKYLDHNELELALDALDDAFRKSGLESLRVLELMGLASASMGLTDRQREYDDELSRKRGWKYETKLPVEFRSPWEPLMNERALAAEEELKRELGKSHVLVSRSAWAIARRKDRDDFLFLLDSVSTECAVVHLTQSGKVESDPRWPSTEIFPTLEKWRLKRMIPDHEGYSENGE